MGFKSAKLLIATIGLCLGSAAMAEDLVYCGTDATGSDMYYDTETIRRYSNDTVVVWVKFDASKDKTVSYRTSRIRLRMNCSDETFGVLAGSQYRANGTVMKSDVDEYPNMIPVTPGSNIATIFKIMCPR